VQILLWIGIACSAATVYNDWQWLGAMSPFVETMMLVMVCQIHVPFQLFGATNNQYAMLVDETDCGTSVHRTQR
jgi:hypothetical protein